MASNALVIDRLVASPRPVDSGMVEPDRPRVAMAGTLIDPLDLAAAVERIRQFLRSGTAHQVVTVNLDFLAIAARNVRFQTAINQADLAVPDGMPLVWLSRLRGEQLPERVAGVDLVDACCALAAETGDGVFLLGAGPGIAESAARQLELRHPGLRIVGTYSPAMGQADAADNASMVRIVRDAKPGFLFVALGAPRQDLWIHDHLDQLGVPVAMGVGCVLDLLAGTVTRAPVWMQHTGFEWSYRLLHEPGRLWRRYLLEDIPTLIRLLLETSPEVDRDPLAAATRL